MFRKQLSKKEKHAKRLQQMRDARPASDFKITIGAAMESGNEGSDIRAQIGHQSRLLKAGLLYADKVTLCSPMVNGLLAPARLATFSQDQKLDLLNLLGPTLSVDPTLLSQLGQLRAMSKSIDTLAGDTAKARKIRSSWGIDEHMKFDDIHAHSKELTAQLNSHLDPLNEVASDMMKAWGIDELETLINKGRVTLVNLGPSLSDVELIAGMLQSSAHINQTLETGKQIGKKLRLNEETYTDHLFDDLKVQLNKIINEKTDYPLFDQVTADLIRAGLNEGIFNAGPIQREMAKHVALSANLLERLPLFDEASADELFSIKEALVKPLVTFRQAMTKYASQMSLAAWDPEFHLEAERIFRSEIEPTVLALEEEMRSNSYLLEIGRRLPEKPFALSGTSAMGVALANAKFLGETWLSLASVGASVGVLAADAWRQYETERKKVEGNQLFFYVKAKQQLLKN